MDAILKSIYQVLDTDDVGCVAKEEFLGAVTEHLPDVQGIISRAMLDSNLSFLDFLLEMSEWKRLLSEVTTDNADSITEEELSLAVKSRSQRIVLSHVFRLIDANGDGKLSKTEMTKALTRNAAEMNTHVDHLRKIGIATNADVLVKPRASMKLIAETETAEPGFITIREFERSILGGENTEANAVKISSLPAGSPKKILRAQDSKQMPPRLEPLTPKDPVVAPPPPKDYSDESKVSQVDDPPPPPPPPTGTLKQGSVSDDDLSHSDTESVDTVESVDTIDQEDLKTNENMEDLDREESSNLDKAAVDDSITEKRAKEANMVDLAAPKEGLQTNSVNDGASQQQQPKSSGSENVMMELQSMLTNQFSDLESQILSLDEFKVDLSGISTSNAASILDDKTDDPEDNNIRVPTADSTRTDNCNENRESSDSKSVAATKPLATSPSSTRDEPPLIPVMTPNLAIDVHKVEINDEDEMEKEDSLKVPHLHGWRPPSRNASVPEKRASMVSGPGARLDSMPHFPASPHPSDRMPIQPGLGAIDIFDPNNIKLPSKAERGRLRSEAISKLWCPEGLEQMWDAVDNINTYKPTARRFSTEEMRQHMNVQMKSFRREQVRRFYEEAKACLDIRNMLPVKYAPESSYSTSYWNWEFKNLARVIVSTLQEVDWLSEEAKPRFRSAYLAMSEFKGFMEKEHRTYRVQLQRKLSQSKRQISKDPPVKQLLSPILPVNSVSMLYKEEEIRHLFSRVKEAEKGVQCKNGIAEMGAAVISMIRYDPQAGKWKERGREVQKFMCEHMTNFRHQIGRKCEKFLNSIISKSKILPKIWNDPNNSFWDFYMQNIAEKAKTALLEVDWLPESAKPLLRALFLTLEQFSKYQDTMISEAARQRRVSTVEWRTGVDTSLKRLGITTPLARSPGIGYFPPAEHRVDPVHHKGLRRKGVKVMPSRKGMAAMDVAVRMMEDYVPAGGKWSHPGVREIKIKEMRDFLISQGHKFHIQLKRILNLRRQLPAKWEDPNTLFWDCHLEEVAANICTHLMEVDWLPEAAKPVLRQAYLSITRYGDHIQRELRKYLNTKSDISLEIRNTIMRVHNQHANEARAQALARSKNIREARAKVDRDTQARKQLLRDTEIRLMFHEVESIERAIMKAEHQAAAEAGTKELANVQAFHKNAIKTCQNAIAQIRRAHFDICSRDPSPSKNKLQVRPSTRGGDGRSRRRMREELEPINSGVVKRPSTAPWKLKKTSLARGRDSEKINSTGSLVSSAELRKLLVEASEGIHKYLDDLGRKHRTAIYNKKRRSQRRGAELRATSQKRLNHRARLKRNSRPRVFSGDIAKLVDGRIKATSRRKEFHC